MKCDASVDFSTPLSEMPALADRITLYRSFIPGADNPQWSALIAAIHGE